MRATNAPAVNVAEQVPTEIVLRIPMVVDQSMVDETVFEETPDIDALSRLSAPRPGATPEEWLRFADALDEIDFGKRYQKAGISTPLLGWYAYIAKHNPETLYQLYNESRISTRQFRHLLQFGLLPNWYEQVKGVDRLILKNSDALASVVIQKGEKEARRLFIEAFFSSSTTPTSLELVNLKYALPAMTVEEKQQLLPRLKSGVFTLDPRTVRYLALDKSFQEEEKILLGLINDSASKYGYSRGRSMSSYFYSAAKYGAEDYVRKMIFDTSDNAGQPTNFYCAACGLAITSDGLLGTPLIEAADRQHPLDIERSEDTFIISQGGGQ